MVPSRPHFTWPVSSRLTQVIGPFSLKHILLLAPRLQPSCITNFSSVVSTPGFSLSPWPLNNGVTQGSVLPTLLFSDCVSFTMIWSCLMIVYVCVYLCHFQHLLFTWIIKRHLQLTMSKTELLGLLPSIFKSAPLKVFPIPVSGNSVLPVAQTQASFMTFLFHLTFSRSVNPWSYFHSISRIYFSPLPTTTLIQPPLFLTWIVAGNSSLLSMP